MVSLPSFSKPIPNALYNTGPARTLVTIIQLVLTQTNCRKHSKHFNRLHLKRVLFINHFVCYVLYPGFHFLQLKCSLSHLNCTGSRLLCNYTTVCKTTAFFMQQSEAVTKKTLEMFPESFKLHRVKASV